MVNGSNPLLTRAKRLVEDQPRLSPYTLYDALIVEFPEADDDEIDAAISEALGL